MNISVNLNIEISQEEAQLLRKYFVGMSNRQINFFSKSNLDIKDNNLLTSLEIKGIFVSDSFFTIKLTKLGDLVCEQLDRDKKINDILDGN